MMDSLTLFTCSYCGHQSSSVKKHVVHFSVHRHLTTKIHCGYMKCKSALPSEASFRSHVIRVHGNRYNVEKEASLPINKQGQFQCPIGFCGQFFFHSRLLNNHVKLHLASGIPSPCLYPECTKTFTTWNSLTGHMSRKHKNDNSPQVVAEVNSPVQEYEENLQDCTDNEPLAQISFEEEEVEVTQQESLRTLAQFYQKLAYKHLVPESTVQIVAKELETVLHESQKSLLKNIKQNFNKSEVPVDVIKCALDSATQENGLEQIFHELRTNHMRKKNFKRLFSFVEPQHVDMGNGKFFYYVPLSENLQECVKYSGWNKYFKSHSYSRDDVLRDFTDGEAFKNNEFFRQNPNAIIIILYQDAFELVTPIGAAKNQRHNVIGVYMALGNLPPNIRFQKDSIQLVALCVKEDFNRGQVYGKIVDDLLALQNVGCDVPNVGNVKVGVSFISGDNLGSHGLGGFLESFSKTIYFTRYCLVNRPSFVEDGGEVRRFKKRTVASYVNALSKLGPSKKSCFGVKFDSEFNKLEGYHVCDGLPCCIGHDLSEGVIAHDMLLFIKYFVEQKWFTLEQINDVIKTFPYSVEDRRDKPVKITSLDKVKLVGGACQLRAFLRFFPLMVSNYIKNADDPVWLCVLKLGEITDIVVAPEIHPSHLPALQCLVEEYIISRLELFPTVRLRAKHHYMFHFAELILQFGPLMKVWTLRFESKHTFFKRAWKQSHNNVNILKTLSFKHEFLQSYVRSGGNGKLETDSSNRFRLPPCTYSSAVVNAISEAGDFSSFEECSYVSIKGTQYRKGQVVILKMSKYCDTLEIGTIFLILIDSKEEVKFLVKKGIAQLCKATRSFLVSPSSSDSFQCVAANSLLSYYPLTPYIWNSSKNLCLKHSIVNYNFMS